MAMPEKEKADSQSEKVIVEKELRDIRQFVSSLKIEDLKNGSWFEKLLIHALSSYRAKVNAEYFRTKYPHLPVDAVVQNRIEMAARYASVEGGITSAAYTGAVAMTITSGGGASPLTLPAGGAAFVIDLAYISQLQIKLAYDISVLYQVPLDLDDPEDLWKLIRIAFAIKLNESAQNAALKGIPAVLRPLLKKYYSKSLLATAKSLPIVGKYLLQKNVIKFAIPLVSIPATSGMNYWTTKSTGRHAQTLLRNEAKLASTAGRMVAKNVHLATLLWTVWLIMNTGESPTEDQRTLLHHVTIQPRVMGLPEEKLVEFRNLLDLEEASVWSQLAEIEDLVPIYDAAVIAVAVGLRCTEDEIQVLQRIADLGDIEFDRDRLASEVKSWQPSTRSRKATKRSKASKSSSDDSKK